MGNVFINFSPAVSNAASKAMRQTIRGWRMQLKSDVGIDDLSRMFNPWYEAGLTTTDAFTNRNSTLCYAI